MRFEPLQVFIFMLPTVQSAPLLPVSRSHDSTRRLESSTCHFYGLVDRADVYNEYTIQMTGWGNDGSASGCASQVPRIIETQCQARLDNFVCTQIYESLHDTNITFRLNKLVQSQPNCVTEALRLASLFAHDEQNIECSCLAQCVQS
ncbi:hypothetical protein F5Y09DRAFT_195256 [Xylaria sp. FL1042]|nr:hypothetical protein F5Y09DRAFT_195256 [Xylaria sp. FL1042]